MLGFGVADTGCCSTVLVQGAESVQSTRMGFFNMVAGVTQNNRPVYKNSKTQYLYLMYIGWSIGNDYNKTFRGITSGYTNACPDKATGWKAYTSMKGWSSKFSIRVTCSITRMHACLRVHQCMHLDKRRRR